MFNFFMIIFGILIGVCISLLSEFFYLKELFSKFGIKYTGWESKEELLKKLNDKKKPD